MAFPKLPGSLQAAGEKAHDASMRPATRPEKHQALKQSLHAEAEKHVAALVKSGADLGKAAEHHRSESARAFGGGDLAHGVVAAKLQKMLQTGAKGGTFYLSSTGQKVYVGKGKG